MTFVKDFKASAGNDKTLVSLIASPEGSFVPKGDTRPISWDNGYKLGILMIGRNPITVRLTEDDMRLLVAIVDEYKEVCD